MAKTLSKLSGLETLKNKVPAAVVDERQAPSRDDLATLQFRVPKHIKAQYLQMAVTRQRTMSELFLEASRSIGIKVADAEIIDRRKTWQRGG